MGRKARRVPRLLRTDKRCVINKREEPGLPVLIDASNQIVWPVTDWFRHQRVKENDPSSSIRTRADHMRQFWEFLTDREKDWRDVDDNFLSLYRNMQQAGQRISRDQISVGKGNKNVAIVKKLTINNRLSTLFSFYYWCHLQGLIGPEVFGITDWTKSTSPTPPQISAKARIKKGKDGRQLVKWSSPLLYKKVDKKFQDIPTSDQMVKARAKLTEKHTPDVAWRNIIMSSVQEEAGLRRAELQRLKVNQIPDWDMVDKLLEGDDLYAIDVKGKGDKERTVSFTPELVRDLREYIDDARFGLVERMKKPNSRRKRRGVYREPRHIFLGHTSGQPITEGAIGSCLSAGLREAGVNIRPHRVRAKFLNDMVSAKCFALWNEKGMKYVRDSDILDEVAEMAGHAHTKTLEHYVKLAKKAYIKLSSAERTIQMELRQQSAERMLLATQARLKDNKKLVSVAKALNDGDKDRAKELLSDLMRELDG